MSMSMDAGSQQSVREALLAALPSLLGVLSSLRQSHSHSDALTPPDLAFEALAPHVSSLRPALGLGGSKGEAEDGTDADKRERELRRESASLELRKFVFERGAAKDSGKQDLSESEFRALYDRLDIVVCFQLEGLVDTGLPLIIVDDVVEFLTISGCARVFDYAESRVKELTLDMSPSRGKGLTLLRMCNDLLRRLSKPNPVHTRFAGRVLSLLARVFPLGERSGVNLRGDFNVENRTIIEGEDDEAPTQEGVASGDGKETQEEGTEKEEEAAGDTDMHDAPSDSQAEKKPEGEDVTSDSEKKEEAAGGAEGERSGPAPAPESELDPTSDPNFYALFWSVQRFFANPQLLFASISTPASTPAPARASTPAQTVRAKATDSLRSRAVEGTATPETKRSTQDDAESSGGAEGPMAELRAKTVRIFEAFALVGKREKELAGAAAAGASGGSTSVAEGVSASHFRGAKRKRRKDTDEGRDDAMAVDAELGGVDSFGEDETDDSERDDFFPKYLTGKKLLEYELRDPSFRRHVLVQYLILFQYLLTFTPSARERWVGWKNKALQANFTLTSADEQWIRGRWVDVLQLFHDIPPEGKVFSNSVLQVLRREHNWIHWKTENCPPIDKPSLDASELLAASEARAKLLKPAKPYAHRLGTEALTELWDEGLHVPVTAVRADVGATVQAAHDGEREEVEDAPRVQDGLDELEIMTSTPDLGWYHKAIKREDMKAGMRKRKLGLEEATPKDDEGLAMIEEAKQSLAWRALRLAGRTHLHLFNKIGTDNVEALMREIEEEKNPRPKPTASAQAPSTTAPAPASASASASAPASASASGTASSASARLSDGTKLAEADKNAEETEQSETSATGTTAASVPANDAAEGSPVPVAVPSSSTAQEAPLVDPQSETAEHQPEVEAATESVDAADEAVDAREDAASRSEEDVEMVDADGGAGEEDAASS